MNSARREIHTYGSERGIKPKEFTMSNRQNWKKKLANFFKEQEEEKEEKEEKHSHEKLRVENFYLSIVNPAFEELKSELKKHGRTVEVYTERRDFASIIVQFEGEEELDYSIEVMLYPGLAFPRPVVHFTEWASSRRLRVEGLFRTGIQDYDISDITKDEIIEHFLNEYRNLSSQHNKKIDFKS
jgi:hypothetical protein